VKQISDDDRTED